MPATEHPTCVLCVAWTTPGWVEADVWLTRTRPFVRERCLCDTRQHRPLVQHPHTHEGCAGYAWQPIGALAEEDAHA